MLNLLFVEASLGLVPGRTLRHPAVTRNARREGKKPEETLLDRTLHHHAMNELPEGEKKGRPDIIHFCLLEALGAPLNLEGNLRLGIHTLNGVSIDVNPDVRLPRDGYRFKTLMERLLIEGQIPPAPDPPLMKTEQVTLHDLKERLKPSRTFALTSHGKPLKLENLCRIMALESNPLAFIGAYPHGEYRQETLVETDEQYSIYPKPLEAWVVTSRLIYEYEKQISSV
jgi:rRNA small subunit pseudouridine methyltransferase Nep1